MKFTQTDNKKDYRDNLALFVPSAALYQTKISLFTRTTHA